MPKFYVEVETVHEAANSYEAAVAMVAAWRSGAWPPDLVIEVYGETPEGKVDVYNGAYFSPDDLTE